MSGPEHNPRDNEQPTREEWDAFEARRRAEAVIEALTHWRGFDRWWATVADPNRETLIDQLTEVLK